MKSIVKFALAVFFVAAVSLILKHYYFSDYTIPASDASIGIKLKYKGLENTRDFAVDENGTFFIASKNSIQSITSEGNSTVILKNNNLNINSMDYKNGKLYFSSDKTIYCYDVKTKDLEAIIKDLPNMGDYRDSIVRIQGNILYVTLGAATNSGVVGQDNTWLKDNRFFFDMTPQDITLKGINFQNNTTGAFNIYGTKSINGQIVPAHFPGNASVIYYNLFNKKRDTYCWGVRNVKGMDFDSEGKLVASIGGMEDRGLRPVKGDYDYIYELKKNTWYGWPDYSGGDPINSPRFKSGGNRRNTFILDNHPSTNPPAPLYQHKTLNTLESIAVDAKGVIGQKNYIYFYDSESNKIYRYYKSGMMTEIADFNSGGRVRDIKFVGKNLVILDSKRGTIYTMYKKQ